MAVYVLGFAFHNGAVALIHKNKGPSCVVGKYNGIGGKVEQGEPALKAMIREFEEETGVLIDGWTRFCGLRVRAYNALIYCYKVHLNGERPELIQKTDERVSWENLSNVSKLPIVPNLRWLIPMALDQDKLSAFVDDNTPG